MDSLVVKPSGTSLKERKKRSPKQLRAIEIACKRLSARALQVLEDAMYPERTPELEFRWRIEAAKEILNRGWGRPKQTVDTNVNVNADESFIAAINAAKGRVIENTTRAVIEDIDAEYEAIGHDNSTSTNNGA